MLHLARPLCSHVCSLAASGVPLFRLRNWRPLHILRHCRTTKGPTIDAFDAIEYPSRNTLLSPGHRYVAIMQSRIGTERERKNRIPPVTPYGTIAIALLAAWHSKSDHEPVQADSTKKNQTGNYYRHFISASCQFEDRVIMMFFAGASSPGFPYCVPNGIAAGTDREELCFADFGKRIVRLWEH